MLLRRFIQHATFKRYGMHIHRNYHKKGSYSLKELFYDDNKLRHVLTQQEKGLTVKNSTITGTMFGKQYSVMVLGIFDMMVYRNLLIDADPGNIYIKLTEQGTIRFYINPKAVLSLNKLTAAEKNLIMHRLIEQHITPLFIRVGDMTNSKAKHLYSLVTHNLFQRSEFLKARFPNQKDLIESYKNSFISHELVEGYTNPLHFTFRSVENANGSIRYIRNHCCLEYLRHDGDLAACCSTCPHTNK
ncbi:hypothetical protein ACQKGI_10055 [Peribacillus muralis]|uniref:hypothetical protein n=1 Tax=Peribacillus muralis TaxID=264697 RepID=UPI00380D9B6D